MGPRAAARTRSPPTRQRLRRAQLRHRRRADDALRRRGLALHGQGREHRVAPRRQARRAQRHRRADRAAHGRRGADPLGAPARPRGPPGGHPRRRGADPDHPPRLDRSHVVRPRRALGGAPRRGPARVPDDRARAPVVIRPATEADAPVIADIQARTWRWAYGDFIAPEEMPVAHERVPVWREHIAAGAVRVFDQDGTVVGYSAVEDDELKSLYVDPGGRGAGAGGRPRAAAQGAGVGSRLLADAQERIRAAGHARAWLYVYAQNAHGCAFYERHGWVAVGGLLGEGHWRPPGRRYERDLR